MLRSVIPCRGNISRMFLLGRRSTHTTGYVDEEGKNRPLSAAEAPFPAGLSSFMRLPVQSTTEGLDVCFVGVPLDVGTSNRSGTRMGPRSIRQESIGTRAVNATTNVDPFRALNVADIGDVAFTLYNLPDALKQISKAYDSIVGGGCIPLTMGGDHTISYPILQAIAKKHGPVAVVHVDAHTDTAHETWGSTGNHATPFRRAVDENLVLPQHFYQIGLRGSYHAPGGYDWAAEQGFTIVPAADCWHKPLSPLMEKIRKEFGDKPVYLTFDIDGIDPCFCPGTGTREIGGLTPVQALEIVRGCKGLNLVGADLVEVSPPYDIANSTAHMAANLLFEILCALPTK